MRQLIGMVVLGSLAAAAACAPGSASAQAQPEAQVAAAVSPDEVARVPVAEARKRVQAGKALLVLAYDSDDRFAAMKLDGAISWKALQAKLPALDKGQEIILYCG